jgi:hypothetical protein
VKREKIDNLRLAMPEWEELKLFNDLLAVSESAVCMTASLLTIPRS